MIDDTVKHYKIHERLGGGGMAEVYRAEDLRLKRPVALKFLPDDMADNEVARSRFTLEAQSASALDHPNICTIYDIDETDDGRLYIVMAFYAGETIHRRLRRGPVRLLEAVGLACQICRGLAKAHEKGIVHRDIKPQNLLVTEDGLVKILDFGIARLAGGDRLTKAGTALGTLSYMAPEQARGREVDHRADVWSLGVVLYQMLCGQVPFRGGNMAAIVQSVLHDQPEPLPDWADPEHEAVEMVVRRALEKHRSLRYPTIQEMYADLSQVADGATPTLAGMTAGRTISGVTASRTITGGELTVSEMPSIAVLPFDDLSPTRDQQFFCYGMADELVHLLTRVDGLRVASRTSASQFAGKAMDIKEIGRLLGVEHLLEGSVRVAGDRLRLTAQLVKVADGYQIWSERYDRQLEDIFEIQDEIARTIVESLRITLITQSATSLFHRKTGDLETYNLYLKGRFYWDKRTPEALAKGIEFFQATLDLDPGYARAYAGMADSYAILGVYGAQAPREVMPRARAAAARALELDDRSYEAHTSLACVHAVYDWDWRGAEESFERALELDRHYATGRQWYAINLLAPLGRFEEADEQLREAQKLDPLSLPIAVSRGLLRLYRRDFEGAEQEYRKAIEIDPNFAMGHYFLGHLQEQRDESEAAIASFEHALTLSPESGEILGALARATAGRGETEVAEGLLSRLIERARHDYVSPTVRALVHLALEQLDETFEALEEACDERAADLIWLRVRPAWDPLRGDPRYGALIERLGLDRDHATKQDSTLQVAPLRDGQGNG